MITGKQKRFLRATAHELKPVFQVGKEGLNNNLITDVRNYLEKHEIMKISVLQNCPTDKEEIAASFEECGFELVQIIGSTIILYKKSKTAKNPIVLP